MSHESVRGEAGPHTAPSAVTLHPFLQAAWLLSHLSDLMAESLRTTPGLKVESLLFQAALI